jgi:transformation/transcription domain-associated protein
VVQVPDVLRKELAGVCKACFSTNPAHRHAHVVAQYRKQFVNELNPEATAFPSTKLIQ